MSITVGNIIWCAICGEKPNTPTHVCKWEEAFETSYSGQADHFMRGELKSYISQLILDGYHRGRKDGMNNLTMKQTLDLQNAFTQLGHVRSLIREILFPEKPK